MKEQTAVKLAIAWFWLALAAGIALTGVFVWGCVELVLWIGRH